MVTKSKAGPRERLLATATDLFYREGIHVVGIDRILAEAGVAKASLYSTFGSKDGLVCAYLGARFDARRARIEAAMATKKKPRDRVLAIFDVLAEVVTEPNFRGCAFQRASAEGAMVDEAKTVCDGYRSWTRATIVSLLKEAGVKRPERVARQIHLLYDGAMSAAHLDRDPTAVAVARELAVGLLDAAIA